jgi:hypothetical protein
VLSEGLARGEEGAFADRIDWLQRILGRPALQFLALVGVPEPDALLIQHGERVGIIAYRQVTCRRPQRQFGAVRHF